MIYNQKKSSLDTKNIRTRTIKLPGIDDDILGEQILFDAYGICLDCKGIVNIEKICTDLNIKEIDKYNRIKGTCKCNSLCLQKINFRIGTELYNKTISLNNFSSIEQGIILYNPTTLKKKLLEISNLYYDTHFDVENFRINYPDEFWNAIWYFQLKGIDISIMLPYLRPNKFKIINTSNKMNKFLEFVAFDPSKKQNLEKIPVFSFINPNNISEKSINEKKAEIHYIKFNKDILFIQHAFQLSIMNIIGMFMYKSPDEYTGNIGFNQKLLLVTEKENNNNDIEEKKSNSKKKKSNLNFFNVQSGEIDLSNINNSISTTILESNEEYNNLWDGNIKLDEIENININNKDNKENKKNSLKIHCSNKDLFETIKDEDINYNIFYDYKEDDSSYDSEY